MRPGTVLGHEAVGTVEEVGPQVRNFVPGDRVVIPSTIGCGTCVYCRAGYYAQCDVANPNGSNAGTAFYGGPESTGPFDGLQAEYARVPYAHTNLVAIPPGVTDEQAVMVSDIFPTAWFGARLAEVSQGDVVLVLGAGPVGQLAALSARMQGAGRVLIVDGDADRLETARLQNAETIDFNVEDPVEVVGELTGGVGADRVIDAVGVDAERPVGGPAAQQVDDETAEEFHHEQQQAAPRTNVQGNLWKPGDAPSQALRWAVELVAKAGTIGIVGVYPPQHHSFPLGAAMNRNLTIKAGNCNHRRYVPGLLSRIAGGHADPTTVLSQQEQLPSVIDAYEAFDRREPGWTKVSLELP
ncbi:alcohol dehydrogenase catalytic domain-containing protein [Actinomadura rudentiformis]|uniref:alcohol dehydrogenase catalytic domain-containing protein n=1 Tax=Actinomadura rudentiformis TaxID=359158 RepID=UPI001CEF6990|nr:alcohol dehydrogenase catalytic domain-containing protein [Actinomadura rudentiformis]